MPLKISMENCFGIKKLENVFSFDDANSIAIYAPNGVMKTSFAKSFKCVSQNEPVKELIYNKSASFSASFNGTEISAESIFVIEPFNPDYEGSYLTTLLVNKELKQKYDSLLKKILAAKKKLVALLNKKSKLKQTEIEDQIKQDFECDNIFDAIRKMKNENLEHQDYSEIEYNSVFDPKVLNLLKEQDVLEEINRYIETYNKLIEESPIFRKGVFTPIRAVAVSSTLKNERFFDAEHKVILKGVEETIENLAQMDAKFNEANKEIENDPKLKKISDKILKGVKPIKQFQDILAENPNITLDLTDIGKLRRAFWYSYYKKNTNEFDEVLLLFDEAKQELVEIEEAAALETTEWYSAKKEFESRFHVPFELNVDNEKNAILGTTAPNISFTFEDDDGIKKKLDRGQLNSLDTLSLGERRALYLLYIIFEFKARLLLRKETIIIVDDIADSFDYKNKYAIIEYLREMDTVPFFKLIILTHNYDFFRTFQMRILDGARWNQSFIAESNNGTIALIGCGSNHFTNPFSIWKKHCHDSKYMFVSMIPFVRNLIEYRDGTSNTQYSRLTSLLHLKDDTEEITVGELWALIKDNVNVSTAETSIDETVLVIDLIHECSAEICAQDIGNEIKLERKVCLSIAIRLLVEKYMFQNVSDQSRIDGNQTAKLFNRYIDELNGDETNHKKEIALIKQVLLMTPENIHLNSFMYEPLIDLSEHHLRTLYSELISINKAT